MISDGYRLDNGQSKLRMKVLPEFSDPLGAPGGPALKDGYVYTRDFMHARVRIDIRSEKATITWERKQ